MDILAAVCLVGIVAAMSVPLSMTAVSAQRFKADGQSIANLAGLAKMRASARFSRSRLRVNRNANTYALENWNKATNTWVAEGAVMSLSTGVTFSFGSLASPPPNTQGTIGFSPLCADDAGDDIANTACIVFNSRGIPVAADGSPLAGHGIYLTDGSTGVYAVTVTATPLIRLWWSPPVVASWQEQQ